MSFPSMSARPRLGRPTRLPNVIARTLLGRCIDRWRWLLTRH
jgi:hypothetical protein